MSSPNRWIIGATIVSAVALACFSMKSKTDDRSSLGYSPYTPRALTLESLITAQAAAEDRDPTAELKAHLALASLLRPACIRLGRQTARSCTSLRCWSLTAPRAT